MRMLFVVLHRRVSLGLAGLWLLQALTGIGLLYRWELDDATLSGPVTPVDLTALQRTTEHLETQNTSWRPASIWTSASGMDRFDVTFNNPDTGVSRIWRLDGEGHILRTAGSGRSSGSGMVFDLLETIHETLFLGAAGHVLLAVSGLCLALNIAMALKLAWPRGRRRWRALIPPARGSRRTRLHAWHRAVGLWLAAPALCLVLCGAAMQLEDRLAAWLRVESPAPSPEAGRGTGHIPFARAVARAQALYPGAEFSGATFPTYDEPWYDIHLRQPGDPRRAYGRTIVDVGSREGRILRVYDTLKAKPGDRLMDLLYPLHTGEALGTPGRMLALSIGLWLAAMIALGISLWWTRTFKRAPA